jgi:hypothetical protein
LAEDFFGGRGVGGEKAEERADGGDAAGDGFCGLFFPRLGLKIVAEVLDFGGEEILSALGEKIVGVFQIAAIGVQGVIGQAALSGQMQQVLVNPGLWDSAGGG